MIAAPSSRWLTGRGILIVPVAAAVVHLIATFLAVSDTRNAAFTRLAGLPAPWVPRLASARTDRFSWHSG